MFKYFYRGIEAPQKGVKLPFCGILMIKGYWYEC